MAKSWWQESEFINFSVLFEEKRSPFHTNHMNNKYCFFLFFCRVYENGKETIMKYENDVLKSKTVNGVTQALSYN